MALEESNNIQAKMIYHFATSDDRRMRGHPIDPILSPRGKQRPSLPWNTTASLPWSETAKWGECPMLLRPVLGSLPLDKVVCLCWREQDGSLLCSPAKIGVVFHDVLSRGLTGESISHLALEVKPVHLA